MWLRLLLFGALLVNWCWISDSAHHCIYVKHLGLFRYFTANLMGSYEINWPQFHLTVIVSIILVLSAKHWPGVIQRVLHPVQPHDVPDV